MTGKRLSTGYPNCLVNKIFKTCIIVVMNKKPECHPPPEGISSARKYPELILVCLLLDMTQLFLDVATACS